MQVICVNHQLFDPEERPFGPNDPRIGDTCEVVNSFIAYTYTGSVPCYDLAGYDRAVYNQKNFAEVSDLDETDLVTEEFEEKYCVPVNGSACE